MKDNLLKKIYDHIDKDEIISKLTLGIAPEEINGWLVDKYANIGDKKLIITAKALKQFKDEYLNIVKQIQADCIAVRQEQDDVAQEIQTTIQNNSAYRAKLQEYIDTEIDIKTLVKNFIVASEFRISQIYDIIQDNPKNTKPDYILINWMQTLANMLEKYDVIINGSPDKIIQQNNINIQILDQHIGVFSKVIREVISRLDYDTSLLFVDIMNEELKKLKDTQEPILPIDARLLEAKKLEGMVSAQLDIPSA